MGDHSINAQMLDTIMAPTYVFTMNFLSIAQAHILVSKLASSPKNKTFDSKHPILLSNISMERKMMQSQTSSTSWHAFQCTFSPPWHTNICHV